MQETVARSLESMSSLAAPGNTPSLDEVREKIERRYANAMGRAELASNSVEGRMLEVQKSTLDMAGASRLEQIRASMAGEQLAAAPAKPAVEAAPAAAPVDKPTQSDANVSRLDEIRASLARDKSGDQAAFAENDRKWDDNAHAIASFLSGANPAWPEADVWDLLKQHLELTKGEVVARIQHNWGADVKAFDDITAEAMVIADTLYNGLVAQFPDRFGQRSMAGAAA